MIEQKLFTQKSNSSDKIMKFINSRWEFTRPHTILGTTITVLTIFAITSSNIFSLTENDILMVILTLFSSLLANVYIVGLNQIYDVEIDKINKPYLPIASGDISMRQAKWLVALSAIFSFIFAYLVNIYLVIVVILGMLIGSLYSFPLTRFKYHPFLASFSISFVRGVLGNIGLYLSFNSVLSSTRSNIDIVIVFLTVYILVNASVIAIFKDIPDIEGDKKFNVLTFSIQMGAQKIFSISIYLLLANYVFAIICGLLITGVWNPALFIIVHIVVAIIFYLQSRKVVPTDKISVWRFYKRIWHFFYLEYIILAFVILI